jgi:hypothetical protein
VEFKVTSMYKENEREDPCDDDIGAIITRLRNRTTWTREAERNRTELCKLLRKQKYIYFRGTYSTYAITQIGQSYLYTVPLNKRGYLKPFRGKDVRVVVVDSGRYDRGLMAGIYKSNK